MDTKEMKAYKDNLERTLRESELRGVAAITDFLAAGIVPPGLTTVDMTILSNFYDDLLKATFTPKLTGYKYLSMKHSQITVFTDDLQTARKFGKVKPLFLNLVPKPKRKET